MMLRYDLGAMSFANAHNAMQMHIRQIERAVIPARSLAERKAIGNRSDFARHRVLD